MKTYRLRINLIKLLSDQVPRTHSEILEYINTHTHHGTTSHSLGCVLGTGVEFVAVGKTMCGEYHSYPLTIWTLDPDKVCDPGA